MKTTEIAVKKAESIFQQTMTSREIAELTGKRHDNVVRDIKDLINQGVITHLKSEGSEIPATHLKSGFSEAPTCVASSYKDASGKRNTELVLDFDSTMILITGYDAKRRAGIIKRWKELELARIRPQQEYYPDGLPGVHELREIDLTAISEASDELQVTPYETIQRMLKLGSLVFRSGRLVPTVSWLTVNSPLNLISI